MRTAVRILGVSAGAVLLSTLCLGGGASAETSNLVGAGADTSNGGNLNWDTAPAAALTAVPTSGNLNWDTAPVPAVALSPRTVPAGGNLNWDGVPKTPVSNLNWDAAPAAQHTDSAPQHLVQV